MLGDLFLRVPAEHVTLEWLLRGLADRSFGVLLLLLTLLGALPGVSVAAGLLLPIPAYQMLRVHPGPVSPTPSRGARSRPGGSPRSSAASFRRCDCWSASFIRAGPRPSRPPSAWWARRCCP
ncbi:exopolysaccharide biosynthesis protein [Roseomonas sp. GCM10028921]